MNITLTNIRWRNQEDSDVFNLHSIKTITLDTDNRIVTIEGTTGKFQAPYCNLTFGGGYTHFEFITKHPYEIGEYLEIAVFESTNKVAIAPASSATVNPSFDYRCRTFIANF